jgi:hypothetical protein
LARSPATNFLAARIVIFASFMALCENQASTIALQRFQAEARAAAVKALDAHRNPRLREISQMRRRLGEGRRQSAWLA